MKKTDGLLSKLLLMEENNRRASDALGDACLLTDYAHLSRGGVWTEALRTALREHRTVAVPPSDTPYIIDDTVIIPSNRKIVAYGATLLAAPDMDVIMMRNEHPVDLTHKNIRPAVRDENIAICHGMQFIGQYFGSKLIPIDRHVAICHNVVVKDNRYGVPNGNFKVNSFHNFTLDKIPEGFSVLAMDDAGNCEAMCHQHFPIVTFMWHPERPPFLSWFNHFIKNFYEKH